MIIMLKQIEKLNKLYIHIYKYTNSTCVKKTLLSVPVEHINKTIE